LEEEEEEEEEGDHQSPEKELKEQKIAYRRKNQRKP